ncbi:MAG: flagellar hook assembly protein FlgD [Devosia sp.]|jgi:flagellar basal-body rod modification protein FlgD|uniref:flagellar hook assembly protein FlgD n=1 Tax=unclassified Devosia TaxID=196773 RepID=UPI0019ECB70C|nr:MULTISPECIES: flagellar hook assembly protein FlgD [unclassified Devosia]MBF0678866.1 flagellar hook assembly protein FlgD [Devosia sp.]WEJ32768.1 flagellar hook assembly protein FlgD [Devosia sp. SD17-2]
MIDGVSGSSGAGNGALSGSRTTIAQNFDTFLQILTTQLKNQNPLDPLDTNQFTQQLVQFTGVEQQLKTNEFLESLLTTTQNTQRSDAVSYIGKQVTVSGSTTQLKGSHALWAYNADANVANANITIKNATGDIVYSQTGSLGIGEGTFAWDGIGSDGTPYPDGLYTIRIDGTNLSGKTVNVSTSSVGTVTAVDFSGRETMVTVGASKVPLRDISEVRAAEPAKPVADEEPAAS